MIRRVTDLSCMTRTPEQLAGRAAAQSRWRDRNRATVLANQAAERRRRRALVAEMKEASPCADCGKHFPAVCMDYDHVGSDKTANVARLVASSSWAATLAEIAKCELVCANCHRIRTARRLGEQNKAISQTS